MRDDGGLFSLLCGHKVENRESSDSDETMTNINNYDNKEENSASGFKKDSCTWLTEHVEGRFQLKNYTGDYLIEVVMF